MMDAEFEGVPVSATDNWVPTTEEVREVWSHESPNSMFSIADAEIEFDRWLAAERAKAWNEGFKSVRTRTGRFSDG